MIKGILILLNILFLTAAIYLAVDTGYDLVLTRIATPKPVDVAARTVPTVREKRVHPYRHYETITARNLFNSKSGETQKAPPPEDVALDKLEKTELRLKLWGTVASAEDGSYAVIESEKERRQNLYRVGDSVETAQVKLILREKVVLTVEGKDEILEIEKPVSKGGRLGRLSSRSPGMPSKPARSRAISRRRITLRRSQIESAMGNLGELMGQAKIEPHNSGGLIISNVKPNSLFRRMGLRNGDIITGVDGSTIATVDDALKLYENLKTSDSASVSIKRKGRQQNIEYKIR